MINRKKLIRKELNLFYFIDSLSAMVGSWTFLILHVIWFAIWLIWQWDINMLTMIVSLEAIILMILLLMAQNRQAIKDDLRDEADLQADLRSMKTGENILQHVKEIKKEIKDLKKKK